MSKEVLRGSQFAHAKKNIENPTDSISPAQLKEIEALYEGMLDNLKPGKIVVGKIVTADSDGVLVDIGYKSHGLIPNFEFTDYERKTLAAGNDIEVILDELESFNGTLSLSYEKAKAMRAWDAISKLFEEGKPVEGTVTHKVRGGLSVDIGIPAFLPGSQVDVQRVMDFDSFVGQPITAHIIKLNPKRGNVIISRRKFLNEQRAETRKVVLDTLQQDQVIQGIVKNITNYGVFIDIGGVDGLLHITDMTWGRIAHPSELVRIGDKISVKVLSFDKDNEKISLGMKQLTDNPWATIPAEIKVGSKVKGKVSSITDYGLFVEIQKGVEGLVHISEISWTGRISDLHKHFKVGQEIEALVVSLDKDNRRMSLSIKQLEKNPWQAIGEQFKEGQKVTGKISNITDFGIFVELLPGIDGLVHVSDLSWTEHITHPGDVFKKSDQVKAIVLGVDEENKRISLGVKQLKDNPWSSIEQEYPVGSIVDGTVSKITNFGTFVKMSSGIEGLVHISELNDKEKLEVGEKRKFRVVKVNKDEHKLGLSVNLEASAPREREQHQQQQQQPRRESAQRKDKADKPKSQLQLELEKLRGGK
jgi:small subunit ribosomal protein S1